MTTLVAASFSLEGVDSMPTKPMVPCRHGNCARLVPAGAMYCEEHKALHPNGDRKTAAERGYGKRWNRERKLFLVAHPFCCEHLKEHRYVAATVVDHIIPHRGNPELMWNKDNWQALCKECHDRKTWSKDNRPVYDYKF